MQIAEKTTAENLAKNDVFGKVLEPVLPKNEWQFILYPFSFSFSFFWGPYGQMLDLTVDIHFLSVQGTNLLALFLFFASMLHPSLLRPWCTWFRALRLSLLWPVAFLRLHQHIL